MQSWQRVGNRIIASIEAHPDYSKVPFPKPLFISGKLQKEHFLSDGDIFVPAVGMGRRSSPFNHIHDIMDAFRVLGVSYERASHSHPEMQEQAKSTLKEMPRWPSPGSVQVLDNVILLRF